VAREEAVSAPVVPVVACWIDPIPEGYPAVFRGVREDGSISALAVPDALWGDESFIDALQARGGEPSRRLWIKTLTHIHAELRARAGGAE
jgi:hypothetical protein